MIKVRLVCVGNLKEKYLIDGVAEYSKRLQKFCNYEIIELNEAKNFSKLNDSEIKTIKDSEAKSILPNLKGYVICLCVKGKNLSSEEFAGKVKSLVDGGQGEITFVIGGSYGIGDEILDKCDYKLSFSSFTFPHQLMRLIFTEQIYRAFNIIAGSAYHK